MVKHIEKNALNVLDLSNNLDWELRYFRIRKGYLYWYANERARESNGKFDLSKVEDLLAHPVKTLFFAIIMEGGKKHKFRAESKEIRDIWVKSLNKAVDNILHASE